jgi:hypothetical protein
MCENSFKSGDMPKYRGCYNNCTSDCTQGCLGERGFFYKQGLAHEHFHKDAVPVPVEWVKSMHDKYGKDSSLGDAGLLKPSGGVDEESA